jgi:hypothetical protein
MRVTTTVLSFLFSSLTFAAPINMACMTEYPTTTFVARTIGNNITFDLIHHNGVKWMPIWSNVVVPNDLPVLNDTGLTLGELGSRLEFTMPESSCQADGQLINCFAIQAPIEINGHKVSLWAVHSKAVNEKSFAGEYNYIYTSMALDIDGKSYYVPAKYTDTECMSLNSSQEVTEKVKSINLFLK